MSYYYPSSNIIIISTWRHHDTSFQYFRRTNIFFVKTWFISWKIVALHLIEDKSFKFWKIYGIRLLWRHYDVIKYFLRKIQIEPNFLRSFLAKLDRISEVNDYLRFTDTLFFDDVIMTSSHAKSTWLSPVFESKRSYQQHIKKSHL